VGDTQTWARVSQMRPDSGCAAASGPVCIMTGRGAHAIISKHSSTRGVMDIL
jgi:hypothetical protein